MKKILIVHNEYKNFGGEDSVVKQEVELLSKHFEVQILKFSNKINFHENIFNLLLSKNNFVSYLKARKIINKFNPDVAYIHNNWFAASNAIFKAFAKKNIKTIVKIHNFRVDCLNGIHYRNNEICHDCNINNRIKGILHKCYRNSYILSFIISRFSKRLYKSLKNKNVYKILVLSNFHKTYFQNLEFDIDKIQVLNNSVLVPNLINNKPSEYKSVVYVGRISEEKGILDLLRAWDKNNDFELHIIGNGPLLNELKNKNKNKKIHFLGFQNKNEITEKLSKSRALIFPTKLYEGQGMVPSEASIIGIPVVSPKLGGMTQLFPEKNSFMYDPDDFGDFIEKINLLNNDQLVDNQGKENRKYTLQTFAEETNNKKIIKFFSELN